MGLLRRVMICHAATFAVGTLYLLWLALPLGEGVWQLDPTIHWWWLLVPAALLGVAAGVCQGLAIGFGLFWPTLVPLIPASLAALWSSATFVVPALFGSEPIQPEPALLIAAMSGWVLYVSLALSAAVGAGRVVAGMVAAGRATQAAHAHDVGRPTG